MLFTKTNLNSVLRKNFLSFLHKSFFHLNPTKNFQYNWHIRLISEYLELVRKKKIKRLLINVPPRTLKSTCISVSWPAWMMGIDPSLKVIAGSYSMQLAIKHSIDCKSIMLSEWYKNLFPKTIISKSLNTKDRFLTTEHGFRIGTSVGGSITGQGGDVLIIDDPHNPTYIHSKKARDKAKHWYENTFLTRLNNPSEGAIILIMQRLHPDDLSSFVLNKNPNQWEKVVIPAISKSQIHYSCSNFEFTFNKNTSIQESHLPKKYLAQLEKEIGSAAFASQYIQNPSTDENNNIFQKKDILFYSSKPEKIKCIIQSWDTSFKTAEHNDYSVCTTWSITQDNKYYLIDLFQDKLEYAQLKNQVIKLHNEFLPSNILIEDHASGQSIIQELKEKYRITPIKQKINKVNRAYIMLSFFLNNKIFLQNSYSINNNLIPQLLSFPNAKHDDIIDSMSQFFFYISNNSVMNQKIDLSIREF